MPGHPRSRWLFLALSLAAALVCLWLGRWQLERHTRRHAANDLARVARATAVVSLPGATIPSADIRITATGSFDLQHQFVLRGRAHDGAPGVEIATPFRMPGTDTAIMVIRGFVPSDDATSADLAPLDEPGDRTIRGISFELPTTPEGGAPLERRGATTYARLDRAALQSLPYPVAPFGVWQERDSTTSRFPIRVGAPALSDGPHLSYAIQWFAFAVIFAGGGIAYSFRGREQDQPPRDERRETRNETIPA